MLNLFFHNVAHTGSNLPSTGTVPAVMLSGSSSIWSTHFVANVTVPSGALRTGTVSSPSGTKDLLGVVRFATPPLLSGSFVKVRDGGFALDLAHHASTGKDFRLLRLDLYVWRPSTQQVVKSLWQKTLRPYFDLTTFHWLSGPYGYYADYVWGLTAKWDRGVYPGTSYYPYFQGNTLVIGATGTHKTIFEDTGVSNGTFDPPGTGADYLGENAFPSDINTGDVLVLELYGKAGHLTTTSPVTASFYFGGSNLSAATNAVPNHSPASRLVFGDAEIRFAGANDQFEYPADSLTQSTSFSTTTISRGVVGIEHVLSSDQTLTDVIHIPRAYDESVIDNANGTGAAQYSQYTPGSTFDDIADQISGLSRVDIDCNEIIDEISFAAFSPTGADPFASGAGVEIHKTKRRKNTETGQWELNTIARPGDRFIGYRTDISRGDRVFFRVPNGCLRRGSGPSGTVYSAKFFLTPVHVATWDHSAVVSEKVLDIKGVLTSSIDLQSIGASEALTLTLAGTYGYITTDQTDSAPSAFKVRPTWLAGQTGYLDAGKTQAQLQKVDPINPWLLDITPLYNQAIHSASDLIFVLDCPATISDKTVLEFFGTELQELRPRIELDLFSTASITIKDVDTGIPTFDLVGAASSSLRDIRWGYDPSCRDGRPFPDYPNQPIVLPYEFWPMLETNSRVWVEADVEVRPGVTQTFRRIFKTPRVFRPKDGGICKDPATGAPWEVGQAVPWSPQFTKDFRLPHPVSPVQDGPRWMGWVYEGNRNANEQQWRAIITPGVKETEPGLHVFPRARWSYAYVSEYDPDTQFSYASELPAVHIGDPYGVNQYPGDLGNPYWDHHSTRVFIPACYYNPDAFGSGSPGWEIRLNQLVVGGFIQADWNATDGRDGWAWHSSSNVIRTCVNKPDMRLTAVTRNSPLNSNELGWTAALLVSLVDSGSVYVYSKYDRAQLRGIELDYTTPWTLEYSTAFSGTSGDNSEVVFLHASTLSGTHFTLLSARTDLGSSIIASRASDRMMWDQTVLSGSGAFALYAGRTPAKIGTDSQGQLDASTRESLGLDTISARWRKQVVPSYKFAFISQQTLSNDGGHRPDEQTCWVGLVRSGTTGSVEFRLLDGLNQTTPTGFTFNPAWDLERYDGYVNERWPSFYKNPTRLLDGGYVAFNSVSTGSRYEISCEHISDYLRVSEPTRLAQVVTGSKLVAPVIASPGEYFPVCSIASGVSGSAEISFVSAQTDIFRLNFPSVEAHDYYLMGDLTAKDVGFWQPQTFYSLGEEVISEDRHVYRCTAIAPPSGSTGYWAQRARSGLSHPTSSQTGAVVQDWEVTWQMIGQVSHSLNAPGIRRRTGYNNFVLHRKWDPEETAIMDAGGFTYVHVQNALGQTVKFHVTQTPQGAGVWINGQFCGYAYLYSDGGAGPFYAGSPELTAGFEWPISKLDTWFYTYDPPSVPDRRWYRIWDIDWVFCGESNGGVWVMQTPVCRKDDIWISNEPVWDVETARTSIKEWKRRSDGVGPLGAADPAVGLVHLTNDQGELLYGGTDLTKKDQILSQIGEDPYMNWLPNTGMPTGSRRNLTTWEDEYTGKPGPADPVTGRPARGRPGDNYLGCLVEKDRNNPAKKAQKRLMVLNGQDDAGEHAAGRFVESFVKEILSGSPLSLRLLDKLSFLIIPTPSQETVRDGYERYNRGNYRDLTGTIIHVPQGGVTPYGSTLVSLQGHNEIGQFVKDLAVDNWNAERLAARIGEGLEEDNQGLFGDLGMHCDTHSSPGRELAYQGVFPRVTPYLTINNWSHVAFRMQFNPVNEAEFYWPPKPYYGNSGQGIGPSSFYFEVPWRAPAHKGGYWWDTDTIDSFGAAFLAGTAEAAGANTFDMPVTDNAIQRDRALLNNVWDYIFTVFGLTRSEARTGVLCRPYTVDSAVSSDSALARAYIIQVLLDRNGAPTETIVSTADRREIETVLSRVADSGVIQSQFSVSGKSNTTIFDRVLFGTYTRYDESAGSIAEVLDRAITSATRQYQTQGWSSAEAYDRAVANASVRFNVSGLTIAQAIDRAVLSAGQVPPTSIYRVVVDYLPGTPRVVMMIVPSAFARTRVSGSS